MDKQFNISISTGTVLKVFFVAGIAWLLYTIQSIVLIVLSAIIISSAVEPAVAALMKRKFPRTGAVITVYLLLLTALGFLIFNFLPLLVSDLFALIEGIPAILASASKAGVLDQFTSVLGLPPLTSLTPADLTAGVRSALNIGTVNNAIGVAGTIFTGFFSTILIIVFSFYFTILGTGVDDFLRIVLPKRHQPYLVGLWKRSQHKIGLWMQGQLLLGLIMGVLIFLGLSVLGVEHALVLAVVAACFELIPMFGPTLSAIPAVSIAFVDGGATLGFATIALYVVAQQFENHLIYPLVVTRVVGVPPLLVILSLIIGAHLAGVFGVILSVPVAATIQELVRDLESGKLREHFKENKTP